MEQINQISITINENINFILNSFVYTDQVKNWLVAILVFLITAFVVPYLVTTFVIKYFKLISKSTETKLDDLVTKIIESLGSPFYFSLGLYLASKRLVLPATGYLAIRAILVIVATFYVTRTIQQILNYFLLSYNEQRKNADEEIDSSVVGLINISASVALWSFSLLFVLQSFSVNVLALAGGLGISGIAIAFALQNILAEIFASLAIYLDKPFKQGDFIVVGTDSGHVERIGIKSTRIKSLEGQILIISNKELSDVRVNNYSTLQRRRVKCDIGVTYSTTSKQLRQIPHILEEIITEIDICEFGRCHFKTFGDYSLIFEIVYFINNSDYGTYMDIQQKVNLEIKERFENTGLSFAFPTQTIELASGSLKGELFD
jgi:small-conductance mechanosensitive channel